MGKREQGKSSPLQCPFVGGGIACQRCGGLYLNLLRFRLQAGERCMTLVDLPGVGESGTR